MSLPPEIQKVKEEIEREGILGFRVVSGSMEPVIMTGEMITVEPIQLDDLRTFDILLFWSENLQHLICHYLWHINHMKEADGSRLVITRPLKGYGEGEDLPTPSTRVLGRIVSHRIPRWTRALLVFKRIFKKKVREGIFG